MDPALLRLAPAGDALRLAFEARFAGTLQHESMRAILRAAWRWRSGLEGRRPDAPAVPGGGD